MRRRRWWRPVAVAGTLASVAVWAVWAQPPGGEVTVLEVVSTSVNSPAGAASDGGSGAVWEDASTEARPRVDAAKHLLYVGGLPWRWRWSPLLVAVREERFLRVSGSRVVIPWRLPVAVPLDASTFAVLGRRDDGSVRVRVAGRERWLAPGATWAALFAGDEAPVWSDGDPDVWREALSQALAASEPVTVWRFTQYGRWPRQDVRPMPQDLSSGEGASRP